MARMRTLVIATNNKDKLREIQQIFKGHYDRVITMQETGVTLEVVEDGATFEENAIKKAVTASRLTGLDALADDSGLSVDALKGAPGVYSARFAGHHGNDKANIDKLLQSLAGVPGSKRTAAFVCAVALCRKDETIITAEGRCEGKITMTPEGNEGFGYDPVFFYKDFGKTFGQVSSEKKNTVSHRARALHALEEKLKGERK